MSKTTWTMEAGAPAPLGATYTGDGVNFAVFSQAAAQIYVCLFDETGKTETQRLALPERTGDVWHGAIAGLRPGAKYALRADGPYRPAEGLRFNINKLLIDPYAKSLTGHLEWHDAVMGYKMGDDRADLSFDPRDSAPYMPRCVVEDPRPIGPPRIGRPMDDTVIYEAHVKGITARYSGLADPGSFLALSSEPVLDHLSQLGITAVELLPVQAFLNDRFLVKKGLVNYWGYQTLGFFAPDPRYLRKGTLWEFQHMVSRLHSAGIEVLLDVVYNHTCEGTEAGPTLSFRGLDNQAYYRLLPDNPRYYINDTGTGNTLNIDHPMVLRMVMDSLRYWVEVMGVDGFRFDLCATLGRTPTGFEQGAAFFDAMRQDPVLSQVKLIAEPWDIGPGGYQLGAFPHPFAEWNDTFRDGVRRFWRGDGGMVSILADRLTGSAGKFGHSGRPATSSVNFLTAHDGFTLADWVAYNGRHNHANGEENRDGHAENFSDNLGVEGPTDDPVITAKRLQRRRNMMATLLLSQGTPMILAGDEIGNGQDGNNNAYAQDNATGWIDWPNAQHEFLAFTRRLIEIRRNHPILRQKRFLHSRERPEDGLQDLFWWRPDGDPMVSSDWQKAENILCAELRMASDTPAYAAREDAMFLIFNRGAATKVTLPPISERRKWRILLDTSQADGGPRDGVAPARLSVPETSVMALVLEGQKDG
ncbi:MAG: glycogen debranching protein GlgX [Pseudomonadota bacterium]